MHAGRAADLNCFYRGDISRNSKRHHSPSSPLSKHAHQLLPPAISAESVRCIRCHPLPRGYTYPRPSIHRLADLTLPSWSPHAFLCLPTSPLQFSLGDVDEKFLILFILTKKIYFYVKKLILILFNLVLIL